MNCPACGKRVNKDHFGCCFRSKGGKAARHSLSPEKAKAMVAAREAKRKEQRDGDN